MVQSGDWGLREGGGWQDTVQGHRSAPRPVIFQAADKSPNVMEPPLPSATSRWAILDGVALLDDGYSPGELSTGDPE